MADTIRIKRSDTTATPVSLATGEIAYSEDSGNFFIGRIADGVPVKIGGKTDVDKLAGIEAGAEVNDVTTVAGRTGDVVIVSADIADLTSTILTEIGDSVIDDLGDVQSAAPSTGQVLTWNVGGYWEPQAAGSGVTDFVALNDTPTDYVGSGDYIVKVNAGATALVYQDGLDGGTF